MRTNIKMKVTPIQSKAIQEIVFAYNGVSKDIQCENKPFLYISESGVLGFGECEEIFKEDEAEEMDPNWFLYTKGLCEVMAPFRFKKKKENKESDKPKQCFTKSDQDKPNLAILFDTSKALTEVANVMEYGSKKYDRMNWEKVDNKERYVAASLRHLMAYAEGETIDESGYSHLSHSICSLLFLLELDNREIK